MVFYTLDLEIWSVTLYNYKIHNTDNTKELHSSCLGAYVSWWQNLRMSSELSLSTCLKLTRPLIYLITLLWWAIVVSKQRALTTKLFHYSFHKMSFTIVCLSCRDTFQKYYFTLTWIPFDMLYENFKFQTTTSENVLVLNQVRKKKSVMLLFQRVDFINRILLQFIPKSYALFYFQQS